jgi:2-keto-4-pentenoate hydratase
MSSLKTSELAADPRVRRGMEAQLAERRARIEAGEEPLGWKVGFGTPAALEKLGTAAPLVGYLMRPALAESGAPYSIAGFANPMLEPEVAVRIGPDLGIASLGPAFEIADVEDSDDVEAMLAGNLFQRGVVLGPAVGRSTLGVSARVIVNGEPTEVEDPEAAPGPAGALVRHVADLLDVYGERLQEDEVIITGSIVPPISVSPGDRVEYELTGIGSISLSF